MLHFDKQPNLATISVLFTLALAVETLSAAPTMVYSGTNSEIPILVAGKAEEATLAAAKDLSEMLEKMTGGTFLISGEDPVGPGLFVGIPGDFETPFPVNFETSKADPDHYLMRSDGKSVYLIGSTPQALEFAVWDFLYRLGHRQYFPGEHWEIIPGLDRIEVDMDEVQRPDYWNRSGPRGAARPAHRHWMGEKFNEWRTRNRTASGFALNTGHAYDGIVRRNRAVFDDHPEFFAKIGGVREERVNPKFCIGNPDLRDVVVADAIAQIESNPDVDSLSLDPSDGGGWCDETCDLCEKVGSVSDRVVFLANEVARALDENSDKETFVGIYAYNEYSPPPNIALHPNVIPSLATAFIRGNQTFDDMISGWSAKSKMLGIREYYGVSAWNSAMPGQARASDIAYLARTIPEWHGRGARFMNAESDDSWGSNGLGYFLAARMLWDVDEAKRVEELVDEFVHKCFGEAAEPMRNFFNAITSQPQISEHLVGRLYRLLKEASEQTKDEAVQQRLEDLILWVRFVELHRAFRAALPGDQQAAFDEFMAFVWRTRDTFLVDPLGIIDWLQRQQRHVDHINWADGYLKVVPSSNHRVGENTPFDRAEITRICNNGIASNSVLDFEPVGFGHRLAPASERLEWTDNPALRRSTRSRSENVSYTWIPHAPYEVKLNLRTGVIYPDRGSATLRLEWWNEDLDAYEVVDEKFLEPGEGMREVVLRADSEGLHRVVWSERMAGTDFEWPEDLPRTTPHGPDHQNITVGRDSFYFYVPKDTPLIGMYVTAEAGRVLDAHGNVALDFDTMGKVQDFVAIEVPEGMDGALWQFQAFAGNVQLLTVPPFGADSPQALLLPREFIEEERQK